MDFKNEKDHDKLFMTVWKMAAKKIANSVYFSSKQFSESSKVFEKLQIR